MNLQPLYDVKERLEYAAVAGVSLLGEDFRLQRAAEGLKPLAAASPVFGKIDAGLYHVIQADRPFTIGDVEVTPFGISHDAAEPVAFRFSCQGKSAAVATDMGVYTDYIVEHLKGLDVLLLESNHDVNMLQVGPYPYYLKQRILGNRGHLSNENSGRLLCRILHDGLKTVLLGHLSKENNLPELAFESVRMEINMDDNPYRAGDFDIRVARRDAVTPVVEL